MDDQTAILNWVRDDARDVVLTGGAVRVGKRIRLQAEWGLWGNYTGPERFTIRTARTRFNSGHRVVDILADVDGPPQTHSLQAWQAGLRSPSRQRRYYLSDLHKNKSGELTVSSLDWFTTAPSVQADVGLTVPLPYAPSGRVAVRAGRAATNYFVGAVTDPRVRVTLLTNSGDGSRYDLTPYLPRPRRTTLSPFSRATDRLFFSVPGSWQPVLSGGSRSMEIEVDENNFQEVSVVPDRDYENILTDFMTGFALRVENADNPDEFVISDIVTVEGGLRSQLSAYSAYPEGSVLFRF
jgi:hypothetical protein